MGDRTRRHRVCANVYRVDRRDGTSTYIPIAVRNGVKMFGTPSATPEGAKIGYLMLKAYPTLGQWLQAVGDFITDKMGRRGLKTLLEKGGSFLNHPLFELTDFQHERVFRFCTESLDEKEGREAWYAYKRAVRRAVAGGVQIPIPRKRMHKPEVGRLRLEKEDIQRLLAEDEHGAASVALLTGLRHSEVRRLRWLDIDEKAGVVHVRPSKHAARSTTVPLTPQLKEVFARIRRPDDDPLSYVFYGEHPKTPLADTCLDYHWKKLKKRLGLHPKLRFHDLRATYATMIVENGLHPKAAQRLLRHSDVSTTLQYYVRYADAQAKDAADFIASLMVGA